MLCLMFSSELKSTRSWSSSEDGVSLLSSASEKITRLIQPVVHMRRQMHLLTDPELGVKSRVQITK